MLGFNGGLLGVRKVPTTSNATGLWFPNEQSVAQRAGIWPLGPTGGFRYWRFANFATTALNGGTLDLGEVELYDNNTLHTGIICSTNFSFTAGSASVLVDGITDTSTRAYTTAWPSVQSSATITFDLGSAKSVTHLRIYSLYAQPRFPASFDLQRSADGTTYVTISTVTVGTPAFVSGNTYATSKVSV